MNIVILLLVVPCFVRAFKEQCPDGKQGCLVDGQQTCCDIHFLGDKGSINLFYTEAKQSQSLNKSSTYASMNSEYGLDVECQAWWCSGTCCTTTECCPKVNAVCCSQLKGCCDSDHNCCGNGCCPASSGCCPKYNHCCSPGYSCCADESGCCPFGKECCGKYCCPLGKKCCGGEWCCEKMKTCGRTLGSCLGAAGILNPTISVLIIMFVLSLKMGFD